jgi:hypothetical protein
MSLCISTYTHYTHLLTCVELNKMCSFVHRVCQIIHVVFHINVYYFHDVFVVLLAWGHDVVCMYVRVCRNKYDHMERETTIHTPYYLL